MMKKSLDMQQYVEQMALLVNLPISPESMTGVVNNFTTIAEIASLVTEFPLPDNIEVAPIFQTYLSNNI
ncbi:DUF4089 domain-containing protein [Aphanothece sacrum]|uniref:Peptidase n=1 Tax=Aphanothece sacrum FPU1 TaxID=1920663 RepID=A0A401IF61_APHSA|nr:DUF4089 domain-containing protein [Aphanothece sacrum]GBF79864.1 peptidase [Aphanothece sacrum FPU1]GBF83916.1 peptidase [Aphanothece sacrum FPU3]